MKKLLFSLAAAATCGVAAAAPATATFDGATFDPAKPDDGREVTQENRIYWEINTNSVPELVAAGEGGAALGYLQINTGNTPLWRTFSGVSNPELATDANLDAAAVETNSVVVSSDVKLTACTEWPTLTDFANEKLALFLFAPEEGDTSGKTNGLYAVGGAMVDNVLTAKAYKLDIAPASVTNDQGWATIAIKSYDNIISEGDGVAAFVIAVNGNIVAVDTEDTDYTGFSSKPLFNAAATRLGNKQLIPAAIAGATLQGLGFQGEGGIDNVNLAANDFAVDAVTMTANITNATVTWTSTGTSLSGTTLTFVPGSAVTFTVATDLDILTVKYNGTVLTAVEGVYTIATPEANAKLEVTAEAALFEVGGVGYANFAAVIAAIEAGTITGGEIDLLADASAGEDGLEFENGTFTIDLNGFTLSAVEDGDAIFNNGASLTIIDSSELKTGVVAGTVLNSKGTLVIEAGTFNDEITNNGTSSLTINGGKFEVALVNKGTLTDNGGKFKDPDGLPEVTGKEYRDDDEDSYYELEDEAGEEPEGPSVGEGEGSVTVDETSGDATVVPAVGKTEVTITLPTGFDGNVIVPSSLDKIVGVPAGKLVIKSGDYVVTGAFSYDTTTGAIALNAEATVNGVPVKPVLDTTATDPFVAGDKPAAKVKTIPGLKYSLTYATDVGATTYTEVTEPAMAEAATMTLTDPRSAGEGEKQRNPNKGFYKVKVSK